MVCMQHCFPCFTNYKDHIEVLITNDPQTFWNKVVRAKYPRWILQWGQVWVRLWYEEWRSDAYHTCGLCHAQSSVLILSTIMETLSLLRGRDEIYKKQGWKLINIHFYMQMFLAFSYYQTQCMFTVNWKSRGAKLSQWMGSSAGGTGSNP